MNRIIKTAIAAAAVAAPLALAAGPAHAATALNNPSFEEAAVDLPRGLLRGGCGAPDPHRLDCRR